MPVEIRELVIKASVSDHDADGQPVSRNGNAADLREAEINLIVEKVLEILKEKFER